ncbi:MAG: MlaD family protein, partial [Gemmatimonadales bacterium]
MKHTNDVVVGATVLLVVGALAGALAWVKRADIGSRRQTVTARFHDVGNTRVGNEVVIRGVIAGQIQAIELAPAGWVDVRMQLDRGVRLPADPAVLLNESSLFGDWQATIVERGALPHDERVRQEIAAASGIAGVLPGTTLPGIGELTAVAGQIAGDVASVAGRVKVAFDDEAARELRGSIRNVSDLSAVLAGTVRSHASDLDTVASQLRSAVVSLNRTATSVQRTMERVDSSTASGDVKHIVDKLAVASSELRRATTQVRGLAERFT